MRGLCSVEFVEVMQADRYIGMAWAQCLLAKCKASLREENGYPDRPPSYN